MFRAQFVGIVSIVLVIVGFGFWRTVSTKPAIPSPVPVVTGPINPLTIAAMRQKKYPGSELVIEQNLADQPKYRQMIVSYQSDGLKLFALLTVPKGSPPEGGFPAIVFNHGYIPPKEYTTTGRYVAYVDGFAKNGFVVLKPDYRGHGKSEGLPGSSYYSPNYVTDVLNAYASLRQYPEVNQNRIGMWGHSMGGHLALTALVVNREIKAAVIWNGVVGTYDDLINHWRNRVSYQPAPEDLTLRNQNRQRLIDQYGTPQSNPTFWNSIDPTSFVADIASPIQLHVGEEDNEVPPDFSQSLANRLLNVGKSVELFMYPGADHNLSSPSFNLALSRSVAFFALHL